MTREEAIEVLKRINAESIRNDIVQATSLGIKALEQEPCDDTISREDAIKALQNVVCISAAIKSRMVGAIEDLPSVTPHKSGHWIVTEDGFECSECGCISRSQADYCQYCDCRMGEPQKSEE